MNDFLNIQFYFSLDKHHQLLPSEYQNNSADLAKVFYHLSKDSAYSLSLTSLEDFCRNSFLAENHNTFYLIVFAKYQTKVSGFITCKIVEDDADIEFICVDSDIRSIGIGKRLLVFLEKFLVENKMLNVERLLLEVGTENKEAIALYNKFKFNKIGVRKKYYKNSEDAYVMEKLIHKPLK